MNLFWNVIACGALVLLVIVALCAAVQLAIAIIKATSLWQWFHTKVCVGCRSKIDSAATVCQFCHTPQPIR